MVENEHNNIIILTLGESEVLIGNVDYCTDTIKQFYYLLLIEDININYVEDNTYIILHFYSPLQNGCLFCFSSSISSAFIPNCSISRFFNFIDRSLSIGLDLEEL